MKKKGKVSVTEICKKAMINTSTFYDHYLDIIELEEKLQNELLNDLLSNTEYMRWSYEKSDWNYTTTIRENFKGRWLLVNFLLLWHYWSNKIVIYGGDNKLKREKIFRYVKEKYDTIPEYSWDKYPLYAVLKHHNNKWYAIIMNISKEKLGLEGNEESDIIDVKCPPEMIGSFRKNKGFFPAYHMNKEHWITILLDGSVEDEKIKDLLDLSYELTSR